MKGLKKVVLVGVLGLVASVGSVAASANTATTINVSNRTAVAAAFGREYFSGRVQSAPSQIEANRSMGFTLTSFGYQASGMRFTYAAGAKNVDLPHPILRCHRCEDIYPPGKKQANP